MVNKMKIYNAWDFGVKPYTYCETALENFLSYIPQDEEEKVIVMQGETRICHVMETERGEIQCSFELPEWK